MSDIKPRVTAVPSVSPLKKHEFFDRFQDTRDRLLYKITSDYWRTREKQILEKLSQLGYNFTSRPEMIAFAEARLTAVTSSNRPMYVELFLDGTILIASWWNTFDVEFINESNKFTAMVTIGKAPN